MSIQVPTTTAEAVAFEEAELAELVEGRRRISPTVAYVARRFGLYLITLWGSISASFFFFRLIPGDPISAMIAEFESRGQYTAQDESQQLVEFYEKAFGLDGSLFQQYVRYLERVVLYQDFGPSVLSYPSPASDLVLRALPWTLGLIGTATLLGWVIGIVAGSFVGWARTSRVANWITNLSLVISHVPAYFVALFLVVMLAYRAPIFPANGAYDASLSPGWSLDFIWSVIKHGTLPVLATMIVAVANWLIGTRALVVNILGEDYLTYAGAKGLSPWRILTRYVMRNAWLPQIAALGIVMGSVINGNVLIERLFRYPGLGNLLVDAISIKDVNTAQAIVGLLIFLVLTLNLLIDLALPLIDPRVKFQR
ncbi:MAG: ABC transporter permease [Thermomicrobiales bacterium]